MTLRRIVLTLAALCAALGEARSQDAGILTGTLKTIDSRGSILIGVRNNVVPFAFKNQAGQPVGFSVDLCHGIAADVAAALNRDLLEPDAPAWQSGVRIVYVPVSSDARLPKVIGGEVDVECGSTTDTAERAKTVAFSPVFFLAGTKLLTPLQGGASSYRDVKRVAVSTGTTNAEVVKRLAAQTSPTFEVVETPDIPAAYALLTAGSVDAVASDDILLAGLIATQPDGHRFKIAGDFLSFEPYAIVLRRDDPDFAALIERSFGRMAKEGVLSARYRRWFTDALPSGENLALPMSAQLTEMYRALGQPD